MNEEELNFQYHLKNMEYTYGKKGDFAFKEAVGMHSLVLSDCLNRLIENLYLAGGKLKHIEAQKHLYYGIMRRGVMLRESYTSLIHNCSIEREHPLDSNEQRDFDRDINMLYMNIRGCLDNIAWCFLYERDREILDELDLRKRKSKVHLFSKDILKASSQKFWKDMKAGFGEWNKNISQKRDPIAHGLPLYIVPKFLTEEQSQEEQELSQNQFQAIRESKFELVDELRSQISRVGTFAPWFANDPNDICMPLYPVLLEDISELIKIQNFFLNYLEANS